jgi:polysaccharide biosynthesis/export protein
MTQRLKFPHWFAILCFAVLSAGFLTACNSSRKINKDYLYFRDGSDSVTIPQKETIIQSNDLLNIQVSSQTLNQEQAAIFNIPVSANGQAQGYQVNMNGNIEMPVLGSIKVAGLTKDLLRALLVQKLTSNGYVKNPIVVIRFLQFNINVLGEVRTPGTQKFQVDRVTIIDAISAAGDLTDYGKREDVTVIREENGKRIYHTIDLRNKNLFESPVYLLQPNDIVYVGPNKTKLQNLSVNPDAQRKTGLFFAILSVILSAASIAVFSFR